MTLGEEKKGRSMEAGERRGGDSGQLMDSSKAPALENWGGGEDLRPLNVQPERAACPHDACVLTAPFPMQIKPPFSLDAAAPRTSQCAAEDMWSERNPPALFYQQLRHSNPNIIFSLGTRHKCPLHWNQASPCTIFFFSFFSPWPTFYSKIIVTVIFFSPMSVY